MEKDIRKKWIWQHQDYPNFNYNKSSLQDIINEIEYKRGRIDSIVKFFIQDSIRQIQINTLTDEAINTSLIEGEVFNRKSVRSSFRKKLDKNFDRFDDKYSTKITDCLAEILLDCNLNKNPLTIKRLHSWHNCLFESRYSKLDKINVASFRQNDNMEVISGAIGFEKVHYRAVPVCNIKEDIKKFLDFCNTNDENIYVKSAIAHLWFVIIHPYDDGNGRIARAITDYLLSKNSLNTEFKLYSISTAINLDKKAYYEILDKTTNLFINKNFDITAWLIWHLNILKKAFDNAILNLEYLVSKTKFWDRHRNKALNERQIKVLNKILDIGVDNFEGGLNTRKYVSMTKVSKATANRDISQLLEYEILTQVENSAGRNISYKINI